MFLLLPSLLLASLTGAIAGLAGDSHQRSAAVKRTHRWTRQQKTGRGMGINLSAVSEVCVDGVVRWQMASLPKRLVVSWRSPGKPTERRQVREKRRGEERKHRPISNASQGAACTLTRPRADAIRRGTISSTRTLVRRSEGRCSTAVSTCSC